MRNHIVALTLALGAAAASAETLEVIGVYEWETESVVGASGLEVSEDGSRFVAVGDQGWWIDGRFERQGAQITGIAEFDIQPIRGQDGLPVSARRIGDWSDAEGLALAPDGTAWVSFERWAHVWRFDQVHGQAQWIKDHPTFYDHAENWQLEATAIAPDGTLYVFSEKPLPEGFPIYRLGADNLFTIEGYLPENDVFSIVGADFAPDGSLYLLERKLVMGIWWQNRIRRIRVDGTEDTILWTGGRGAYGNLEGIALWEDAQGLRITLVSDNNANGNPTQFVEFRLVE